MKDEQPSRDLIGEVRADHEEIKGLLADVETATGDAKIAAFQHLVRKLAVHETAEEMIVHPLARPTEGQSDVVGARIEEEEGAKKALASMERMDVTSSEFDAAFQKLKADVMAHAESEEQMEHPRIIERTDHEKLLSLAALYRTAEATAPTHPHPSGPSSATGNMLVGPLMSIIDRTRDAIRGAFDKAGH